MFESSQFEWKSFWKVNFKPDASQIWPFKSVSFLLPTANSPYWAIFAPSGWNSDPFLPPPVLGGGSGGVGCLFVKLVVVSKMVAQNKQQSVVGQSAMATSKKNYLLETWTDFLSQRNQVTHKTNVQIWAPYDSPCQWGDSQQSVT